jgi:hypothetical protein
LTCKAVGAILGRHHSTVRGMCERRELTGAYRHRGKEWRVPPASVQAYLADQRESGPRRRSSPVADLSAWRKVS